MKAGDTVRLIFGGPLMTVENIYELKGEKRVTCLWFVEGDMKKDIFRIEALRADDAPTAPLKRARATA